MNIFCRTVGSNSVVHIFCYNILLSDHEPPEQIEFNVYILFGNNEVKLMATEIFTYFLDPTCFLARYLADR